ncbi:T9SS type B sorting domain-containing protein [Chryseobacterium sp. PMSZPI]|uniref:T9SS type B sorting domain-containing protein n=1 Tax=Chryseobacterium sp. PMSZPI TaxID=1033900 RepID=UPI0039A06D08
MKKKLLLYFIIFLFCINNKLLSQTYQLTGNPVNTTGWTIVPSTIVSGDFVRLVNDQTSQSGAIKLNDPINLKYCDKWRVEFDFRIDGNGTSNYGRGDGFAFWYLANPPITSQGGSGLGIPQNAVGLMVGFDIYNNTTGSAMSKVHLAYGVVQNTTNTNNIEFFNTTGSSFHSPDLNSTQPFVGTNYKHVEVTGQIDPATPANWIITVRIDGNTITSQSFAPSGNAANMTQGYFGFSASTGAASARNSIKNVKIYTDKVPVLQSTITKSFCPGTNSIDLTSFNAQLTSNPNNYIFTYYIQGSSTPIANPTNFQFSSNTTIIVSIKDSTQLLCDNSDSKIQLNITPVSTPTITASSSTICYGGNITLTSDQTTGNIWSNGETTPSISVTNPGTYTLTNNSTGCTSSPASITITGESDPNVQITGNQTLCESPTQITASSAGTGNTYTWSNGTSGNTISVSAPGTYTVTVKTPTGCQYQKSVDIVQGVIPVVQNSSLSQCSSSTTATFNLTSAQNSISSTPGVSFDYYISQADAVAGNTNTIANPTAYVSGNATIYVRVKSSAPCSKVAELQLNISTTASPAITASSSTICYGGSVTLTSSQTTGNTWSTGATTQSITTNTAGTYTLTSTIAGCTSLPTSITITAETDPDIQITGNLILCESPTQITASSTGTGNTYSWSNGTTGSTTSVSNPGTYTVTVKTPAGCQYQRSVTVTQGAAPTVQNAQLSQCSNSSTATFNLTSAQNSISSTPGVSFDYYISQADAVAGNTNTIANPTAYVSGNATIYVRVKSSAPCSKVAELQLNISTTASPAITASSSTICYGGNVTLTSNQTTGNTWSTGATTQSITINTAGTYTLTNTITGCTSLPTSVTITAETDPDVQITGNLILCEPSTLLTASSTGTGNTYSWSNGTTGSTTSVSNPGTYTVTVKTPAGCQYQRSVTVTQGAAPTVQNAQLSQCSDSSTATFNLTSAQNSISSTPGVSFDYYISQADAVAGNTNTIANPTAYVSGNATIYVRVKSTPCSKVAELQLIVNVNPVPFITASAQAICDGSSVTLTSSLPTGNTWSTGATTSSITINTPGTYTLTNSNGSCTSNAVSITITASTNPNLQITGNTTFCQGSSTTLTATATGTGNTFSWSNGLNTNTNTITTPGTYTATVTTATGCQYQKSVTVAMDPSIIINIATPAEITCTTSQVTLNASTSVYQPGATFLWTATGGGNIVSGGNTLTPTVNNGGNYTLRITSATPNGCVQQSSVTVIRNTTSPTVILSSPKLTICRGESVTITASGATTYVWASLPGTGNTQTVSPSSATTYSVTGTGANGCTSTANITINVVPEIVSTLHDIEICQGDTTILDAGPGANYTYLWNNGATTRTINTNTAGTYTVTINNGYCSKTFSSKVSYIPTPQILEVIYKDPVLTIIAKNSGVTPLEYSIDGGVTWQSSNIFQVLRNTKYSISVRNKGVNCSSNTEYYTFFMANVITPNNDGINDVIDFTTISKYGNFEGNIFDRYGKSIFKISIQTPVWDGKYLGNPLPTGTYWYKLSWENRITKKPEELSGWVLLKNRD